MRFGRLLLRGNVCVLAWDGGARPAFSVVVAGTEFVMHDGDLFVVMFDGGE